MFNRYCDKNNLFSIEFCYLVVDVIYGGEWDPAYMCDFLAGVGQ